MTDKPSKIVEKHIPDFNNNAVLDGIDSLIKKNKAFINDGKYFYTLVIGNTSFLFIKKTGKYDGWEVGNYSHLSPYKQLNE
ncbi:hypothetical protein LCGC14_2913590 [marine sediment metagenome]|uniref:Uncharacterized protein n=1 Tax=marine sediment metagenome TaxID=412755 RepID=A0A0F8XQZ0_9ZZZZ